MYMGLLQAVIQLFMAKAKYDNTQMSWGWQMWFYQNLTKNVFIPTRGVTRKKELSISIYGLINIWFKIYIFLGGVVVTSPPSILEHWGSNPNRLRPTQLLKILSIHEGHRVIAYVQK